MGTLLTLAYPQVAGEDGVWIDGVRSLHDPHARSAAPHFTLVFACEPSNEEEYLRHVVAVGRRWQPISFVCRRAMLDNGIDQRTYVYLVPKEGAAGLSRLHVELYTGALAEHLRLNIPFVPHITLGSSTDRVEMKQLCDTLNKRGLCVRGAVEELTVVRLDLGSVWPVSRMRLGG